MKKPIVIALIAIIASWILLGASAFAAPRAIFYVVQAQPQQSQAQRTESPQNLNSAFHSDTQQAAEAPLPANAVIVKSSAESCRCGPDCPCKAVAASQNAGIQAKTTQVTSSTRKRYRSVKYERNQPGYTAVSGDGRSTGFVQFFRYR